MKTRKPKKFIQILYLQFIEYTEMNSLNFTPAKCQKKRKGGEKNEQKIKN